VTTINPPVWLGIAGRIWIRLIASIKSLFFMLLS
jgi:hypothetical protein